MKKRRKNDLLFARLRWHLQLVRLFIPDDDVIWIIDHAAIRPSVRKILYFASEGIRDHLRDPVRRLQLGEFRADLNPSWCDADPIAEVHHPRRADSVRPAVEVIFWARWATIRFEVGVLHVIIHLTDWATETNAVSRKSVQEDHVRV